ncbi:MAG: hypothetical protein OHK0021_16170 [Bryobacter sp.]
MRYFFRRTLSVGFLFWLTLPVPPAAELPLAEQVKSLLAETSRIMGLAVKRPVPAAYMSKAELQRYLAAKMKKEVDPRATQTEEQVIKMLGLAPADFQLRESTLDLMSEQAAAFYDFKLRKLFVIQPVSPEMTTELLIHELGHALQDQHFNLRRFLGKKDLDDDAALARMAVMEGQAMWLMAKQANRVPAESVLSEAGQDNSQDNYPVLGNAPLYLRASLLFPYEAGLRFQSAVCEKHADCLSRVFLNPPRSTAHILHPDLYFAATEPESVPLPPLPAGGWQERTNGVLGEFDFYLILRTHNLPTHALRKAWVGASYRLAQHKKSQHFLLQHTSRWKDAAAAQAWFTGYRQVLAAKWKVFEVEEATETATASRLVGRGDSGRFRMERQGREVVVLEGLPADSTASRKIKAKEK